MGAKKLAFFVFIGVVLCAIACVLTYCVLKTRALCKYAAPQGVVDFHNWAHEIQLDKDQRAKLEPIEVQLKKALAEIQPQLARERIEFCCLMCQESVDEKKLDEVTQKIDELESKQQRLVTRHLIAMRGLLRPEQRAAFFNMIMKEVCQSHQRASGDSTDMCGLCNLKAKGSGR